MRSIYSTLLLVISVFATSVAHSLHAQDVIEPKPKSESELYARSLLDEAKAKMMGISSLVADFDSNQEPTRYFDRTAEITLLRPNKFKVVFISGAVTETRKLAVVSDGEKITKMNEHFFVAYEKPVHAGNFFLGVNFLVQFFFDTRPISFDPTDDTWGRSLSVYDTNASAYDRDVTMSYLGTRPLENTPYAVVEVKYNTYKNDIRQQIYIGPDKFVHQVDTYYDGKIYSQKFRNFRVNADMPSDTFKLEKTAKMPLLPTDPVRLGEIAPDFTLPGYNGGELTMKALLKDKKGMLICVLNGSEGKPPHSPDHHLGQMRALQEVKDKFEKQGLVVVCIVGGAEITPDLISEMKLNWMPDVSRFNYPIAIDVDLERGIQGSAYENFQLRGRNCLLLDKDGRVLFGSTSFAEAINQLAFYQSLAQIGFTVSQADLESASR